MASPSLPNEPVTVPISEPSPDYLARSKKGEK